MKERVVYFLGAGFSAPLGLPVMSDFLIRSKDLYFGNPDKYGNFKGIFETINRMGRAKNYYAVDLFNIEEILSLLEMEDYVGGTEYRQTYISYLRDVIVALTPAFPPRTQDEAWNGLQTTSHPLGPSYSAFVAALFGLEWIKFTDDRGSWFEIEQPVRDVAYAVISLNYDLVLESSCELLKQVLFHPKKSIRFAVTREEAEDQTLVPLAKLHGSVKPLTIIPPTWNKVANDSVLEAWKLAYSLLAEATQIRVIGYSLPSSDTYVRYLLSSAVLQSEHLKRFDVICLDDGTAEQRFRSFITFYRLRFKNANCLDLLRPNYHQSAQRKSTRANGQVASFDQLEPAHEEFMRT